MKITVVGIGKLGLGFALLLENSGHQVLGVDLSETYVKNLNQKTYETYEPDYVNLLKNSKHFRATTSLKEGMEFSDLIYILVQTPNSGSDKFYDHTILSNLLVNINRLDNGKAKCIIIGCTVMPGYSENVLPALLPTNYVYAYNPEFVAQGAVIEGFRQPDMVLIGTKSQKLIEILSELYTNITFNQPKFCIVTPTEAEIVKIGLNAFLTTKISYANMISDLCKNMNVDAVQVLNSIGSDSRIGNKFLKPGDSYGGPCLPRDTRALALLLKQNNIDNGILNATSHYNDVHVTEQVRRLHPNREGKIIFNHVSYKKDNMPIIDESASIKKALMLAKDNQVEIWGTCEIIDEIKKQYGNKFCYLTYKEYNFKQVDQIHLRCVHYNNDLYDFRSNLRDCFQVENLDQLHNIGEDVQFDTFGSDTDTWYHKQFYSYVSSYNGAHMKQKYFQLVREVILPYLGINQALVQTFPSFRIQLPEKRAVAHPHTDYELNHPYGEINFTYAFTDMYETNTIVIETSPGNNQYKRIILDENNIMSFNGNQCRHYNDINKTGKTRVSMDFRVLPLNYFNPDNVKNSYSSSRKFSDGGYYTLVSL